MDDVLAKRTIYIGLFFITLSSLMYEILLTRLFSAITYYHFAFVAITLAMFGLTAGAIIVALAPLYRSKYNFNENLTSSALLFSSSMIVSILFLINTSLTFHFSFMNILLIFIIFFLIALPFLFSGINVCLILKYYKSQINTLYAMDLAGAGLGCVIIVLLLNVVSGPLSILGIAFLSGIGALMFSKDLTKHYLKDLCTAYIIILIAIIPLNITLEKYNLSPFQITWTKGINEISPLYEKWNSFSRVTVTGNPYKWQKPFGWGLSELYSDKLDTRYLMLQIDNNAATPLINFNNDLTKVEYLKYDITNIAHYLRPNSRVLIIGVGGGRDILSALVFHQKNITGLEVNNNILNLLINDFSSYTGNLIKYKNVTLINDEARSYIHSTSDKFDIIQMSLIDTWASTAAGAFALTENSLYTLEAWETFINHLTPNGILSVSRWYTLPQPVEIYRLAFLASSALQKLGIKNPADHIVILAKSIKYRSTATLLLSPNPFSKKDIMLTQQLAQKLHFNAIYLPNTINDVLFKKLTDNDNTNLSPALAQFNLSAPTDDKPFFFFLLKLKHSLPRMFYNSNNLINKDTFYINSIEVIIILVIVVILLTLLYVIIPLLFLPEKASLLQHSPLLIYFFCIGFGFMLIEITQMQRLILFLGNPTYSLSVVLLSLLLSTGLGSLFLSYKNVNYTIHLIMLICILSLVGFITSPLIHYFISSGAVIKIFVACTLLILSGFFMGAALPLGMKQVNENSNGLIPWLWGINGTASICGSVFAIIISLSAGISSTYFLGVLFYMLALLIFVYKMNPYNTITC